MSKFIILTDTHFGVRQNSRVFHDNMELFYKNIFFPYLEGKDYDILHGGDVFDDRRKIDTSTAQRSSEYFFKPLWKYLRDTSSKCHIVLGNHDVYYKNTLKTNSVETFLKNHDFSGKSGYFPFEVVDSCREIENLALIPWIVEENREATFKFIENTRCEFALGHFELLGHNYSKVQIATHGDDPAALSKFKAVLSGHYHYKQSKGNIHYLGAPTEHTWIDQGTSHGFHVFDTATGEIEFISNPYNMFDIVSLGETPNGDHERFYRLTHDGTSKQSEIDSYVASLFKEHKAIKVDVIVKRDAVEGVADSAALDIRQIEDTPTFIKNYVGDDEEMVNLLISLYNRAIAESDVK